MAGLGIGVAFLGYWLSLTGYCWVKGYDVTQKQMWSSAWPPNTKASKGTGAGSTLGSTVGDAVTRGAP